MMKRTALFRKLAWLVLSLSWWNPAGAEDYFLDAEHGDDTAAGTAAEAAWQSLARASAHTYGPGDRLLLRSGQTWRGALLLQGSGTATDPVVVTSFGDGARPRLEGDGATNHNLASDVVISCAVRLYNLDHWELRGLEITNYNSAEEDGMTLAEWEQHGIEAFAQVVNPPRIEHKRIRKVGVLVQAKGAAPGGARRGFTFADLEIHGINGDLSSKHNGGIFVEVFDDGSGTPLRIDDVRFENNLIRDVDRTGISNMSAFWRRDAESVEDWTPNRGWVFRGNTFRRTGANALIVRVAENPVMEHNLFDRCAIKGSGNAAFNFNTDGAVWQFNEFRYTKANQGDEDAGGVDSDFRSRFTVIRENYSHHNDYGMLVTGGPGRFNVGTEVYRNLFYHDGQRPRGGGEGRFVIRVSGSASATLVRDNTIVVDPAHPDTRVIFHKRWQTWADDTTYRDNLIFNAERDTTVHFGESSNNRLEGNHFLAQYPDE
ncbi:hypothetical protein [Actomonas aquatica]|uniref:Right handed beta helix domain-containing protein n=1 Tax=Actomonas aquatica TaxID=2866162 RepID=A0ABZ1C5X1_9BACT|nr:hypothetical protein [Opitutus sp. WL0086]WRQ86722.1 hypothetical protein K1X11_018065 [Opitutus sp. WL0086]